MAIFNQPFLSGGFPSMNRAAAGAVGGWVELGRTTLGADGDTISVSSLADKRYYMVLADCKPSSSIQANLRLGNSTVDTGNNYAHRRSVNGGADNTVTSTNFMQWGKNDAHDQFQVGYIANLSGNEKLFLGHNVTRMTAGAGTAPERVEATGKWVNTSNPLDIIQCYNNQAGDFASGSELVVLEWDSADTHTDNFWEELASTELSVAGDDLSSGTITAKKYLWVQAWYKNDGAADINNLPRFNGDAGSNYAARYSVNGAADVTRTSRTWLDVESGGQDAKMLNMFIINNASNEKLVIFHQVDFGSSGATNAPARREGVGKWVNTSNQITEINLKQLDAGDYTAGSIIKVWGAD